MSVSFEINTPNGPAVHSPIGHILLADLFEADTEIGVLKWKVRPVELFASNRAFATWNTRYAWTFALDSSDNKGYRVGAIFDRMTKAHRVLFAMNHGCWPRAHIDHINGVVNDNRACNLRDVSASANNKNLSMQSNNTSGVSGVCWAEYAKKWRATINADGKQAHIGYFTDLESAAFTRKVAEEKLGFHANHGRKAMGAERANH